MRRKANPARQAHGILLVTFCLYLLYARILPRMPFYAYKYPVLLLSQLILFLPGMLILHVQGKDWAEEIAFRLPKGRTILLGLTAMVCAYPLAAMLNLVSLLFVENQVSPVVSYMLQWGLGPALLVLAVLPAFAEEFLCRGILYGAYRRINRPAGILLSSLIFGLFHMNLNQFFYAFFLGIVFALFYEASGSILVPMVMHFSVDAFNVCVNFLAGTGAEQAAQMSGQETAQLFLQELAGSGAVWMTAACLLLLILFSLVTYRTFVYNRRSLRRSGDRQEGCRHLTDPLLWIYLVTALWLTIRNTIFV